MSKFSPSCVLFDLDGTLVDTAPDLARALNLVRADLELPPLALDVLRPRASQGAVGLLDAGLGLRPDDPDFETRRGAFLNHYRDNLVRDSRLFSGMAGVLQVLENAGIAWGVVTNKPAWLTEPLLDLLGLLARSACVVSGDTTPRPKPAPDPLQHACRQMRLTPSECLYVGDDRRDALAAQACGMPMVAAAWGYIAAEEDVCTWSADAIAAQPQDLEHLITLGTQGRRV